MIRMNPVAQWTDDCQGKKDYDAPIICISTRYWPRGGGSLWFDTRTGEFNKDGDPSILPSAKASICIRHADGHGGSDLLTICAKDFEVETQEEVQRQVEEWTQKAFERIVKKSGGKNDIRFRKNFS